MSKHGLFVFYRQVYRRALIRLEFGEADVITHDAAVRRVEYFAGRPLNVAELTPELLERFRDRLRGRGLADGDVHQLVHALERIRRSFNPPYFRLPPLAAMEPDAGEGTVRHFFENVYLPQRLIGCTEANKKNYQVAFRRLRSHFGRELLIGELTDAVIAKHLDWLLKQGISAKSVNSGHRAAILAVWRMAYDERLIDRLPRVKKLKEVLKVPDAWSVDEMNRLLSHCHAATTKPIVGIPVDVYWQALLRVAWWTGLRRGTLLKLRRSDVDLPSGWLTVSPEIMKNRRGAKFRLGEDAIDAIRAMVMYRAKEKLLFPWGMNFRQLSRQFERIIAAAGLPPSDLRMGMFHKIRRSTATKIAELAGVGAASSLLGHSNSVITERYIDPSKLPGHDLTAMLPGLSVQRPAPPDLAAG